jgi:hypothetical protein
VDIKAWCQEYVRKLTADAKAHKPVPVELSLIPGSSTVDDLMEAVRL